MSAERLDKHLAPQSARLAAVRPLAYAGVALVAVCTLAAGLLAAGSSGARGVMSGGFGHKGKVTSNIAQNDLARGGNVSEVKVFDDGRIGVVVDPESRLDRPTVLRFRANGSLDTSFSDDGIVKLAKYSSVAFLEDGKFLVSGQVGQGDRGKDVAVWKYDQDGSPDSGFAKGGLFRLDLDFSDGAGNPIVTSDGRIVVQAGSSCHATTCGYSFDNQWLLMLSESGRLIRKTSLPAESPAFRNLTAAPDGTLLAIEGHGEYGEEGSSLISIDRHLRKRTIRDLGEQADWSGIYSPFAGNGFYSFAAGHNGGQEKVLRVLPDGTIDPSFGQDGSATCAADPLPYPDGHRSVSIDSEGRLLAGGSRLECQLMRLMPDGSFDDSFAGDGILSLPSDGGYALPWIATPAPGGKVLLALWDYSSGHVVLNRLKENGDPDPGFGSNGGVDLPVLQSSKDKATGIVSVGRGKTVTVGSSQCDGYSPDRTECQRFALVKRNARGRLVSGFGNHGQVPLRSMKAQAITRSKAGDLVVSGSGRDPDEAGGDDVPGFAIARFDADGSPDESFGSDGRVHTYFPGTTRYASALAVATQADGRIVATGQVVDNRGGGTRFLPVTRYKRNGSPDRSFGVDGLVKLKLHGGESGSAVKVLPEGRILVAGQDDHDPVVIRLKPDGRLDRKFGKRGIARPRLEERPRFGKGNVIYTPQREATAMVLLPGGGILAGAAAYNRSLQAGVVFGLRANGKPRRRFGRKGIRYTGGLSPNSLSLDRCRRLLVSGAYHRGYHTQSRFGVARIKLNGAADRRFGHGKTLLPFGRKSASGAAGSTRSGRSVVVAGFRERPSTNYDFALASFSVGKRCR